MDNDLRIRGGTLRRGEEVRLHWPDAMPVPRVGEALSIDTTSLMLDRGKGAGPSSISARSATIGGFVELVSHHRDYVIDPGRGGDRVQWYVLVELAEVPS